MTAGMRVSDYIKTDSSDNMSKKADVVGSSNSVDMSDTIYARPQAKNEAGNNDGTDMAENLLNDMNQTFYCSYNLIHFLHLLVGRWRLWRLNLSIHLLLTSIYQ